MALAGYAARAAAAAVTHDVERNVTQAIGKPLGTLTGVSRAGSSTEINWVDFNYPPVLRLIHYNLDELPSTLTGIVRCFNFTFHLTTFLCLLNFVDNIAITAALKITARTLIQSAIHLLLLPVAAFAVFYAGYRGLAEPDNTLLCRFKAGQPILAIIYLLFILVPWGPVNGFIRLGDTQDSTMWQVMIIVESCLWIINFLLASWNTARAYRSENYGTSLPSNQF